VLAAVAAPFLSGGGRGVLWFLLQLAIVAAWAYALSATLPQSPHTHSQAWDVNGARRWFALTAYFVVYVAGFSLLLRRFTPRPGGRLAARIALPVLALLSMLLPALIGFVADVRGWDDMRHPFFPFWVISDSQPSYPRAAAIVCAALVLLFSAPRLVRGVTEVLAARRVRAARPLEVAAHDG
jgi:hypothetical protein